MDIAKGRRIAAWALFAAGVVGWGWGIACFFEPLIWERGLNTIAVGILCWCLALGAAEDYPRLFTWAGRTVERLGRALRLDLSTPERRFAALGLVTFAVPAGMLAQQYLYLLKFLAVQMAFVFAAAAAGGLVHLAVHRGLTRLAAGFFPQSEWRRAAGVWGGYGLAWAAALHFLFPHWEALGTDPIVRQFLISLAASLFLAWLSFGRLKGPAGRVHRPAGIAALVLALAAGGLDYSSAVSNDAQPRLRVLLLTLDTTRADYLSVYGYPRETSPNLDALARSGARFARCFSPSGLTDPSHASILTGMYPRSHGLNSNLFSINAQVPSLAEYFTERGFITASVGCRDHVTPEGLNVPGFMETSGVTRWMGEASAPEAFRRAANYLYRHRDQDLFLWVHFFDPHESYRPHPGISDHFYGRDRGKRSSKLHLKDHKKYPEKEVKYRRDLYAGEIFYMDLYIGKLLRLMEEMEPRPDQPLLVAVTADHGEFLGEYQDHPERLGFGHGPIYNPGVHVPLIFSWPGVIPSGTVINDVVQGIDLAPTLAAYALDVSYPGQGANLRPVIEGRPGQNFSLITHCRNHSVAAGRYDAMYAIVKDDWKYTIAYNRDGELFDLSSDWAEAFDLSAALPDRTGRMLNDWEEWMRLTPEAQKQTRKLDDSEKRALRALGYVE